MTLTDEDAFRKAGAGEQLIATLWDNDGFRVQPGPPFSKEQLIALLQAGIPPGRVERMVRERQVKMAFNKAASDEIAKAGANETLLGVVLRNLIEEKSPDPPKTDIKIPPPPAAPTPEEIARKYSEILYAAEQAVRSSDYSRALDIVVDAKKLDRSRPEAFKLSGSILLNHLGEITRGGLEYKEAIDRGAEVEFRVRHLHGRSKVAMRESSCEGRAFISKLRFRYVSDDKQHKFEFTNDQIISADVGSTLSLAGGFHIKVSTGSRKPEIIHFHSSRDKGHKEEDKLIVDLIRR
jgi:hypothetical protein